ncbi:hypothetical protein WMZ97_18365 [Lentibacillus sp. N15]|uniref:hypothetical protein n=1 Tax=Lentibacillus songyuanensis TaxID=3136161 RepID=UPI0031BACA49
MSRTFKQGPSITTFDALTALKLPTLSTILKEVYGEPKPLEEADDSWWDKTKEGTANAAKGVYHQAKGTVTGYVDVGVDTVGGLWNTVRHPIDTGESMVRMAIHPIDTSKYIGGAIKDSFVRDMINGDAESRAHWTAYAKGTILTTVFGTKGTGAVTKTGVATTKAGAKTVAETAAKSTDLSRFLPYAPQHQLATNGVHVPYNVFDGWNLRDQVVLKAERAEGLGKSLSSGKIDYDLAKDYIRVVEYKTGLNLDKRQIKLLKAALRENKYKKMTPLETLKHRSKFNSMKNKLISEWEVQTGQKWPRYTEEVYDKRGRVVRDIGQPYDAHHIIENNFGGPHEWWNIHPARFPDEHQLGIHGKESPSNKLFPRR